MLSLALIVVALVMASSPLPRDGDDDLLSVTSAAQTVSCSPLYGQHGGWFVPRVRPALISIRVVAGDAGPQEPVSVIVYEHGDGGLLSDKFCTAELKAAGECEREGEPIYPTGKNRRPILGKQILGKGPTLEDKQVKLSYPVEHTGYYCVRVINPGEGVLQLHGSWQNPYGELPAEFFPLQQANAAFILAYGAMAVAWAILLLRYRATVMRLQHYMSIVVGACLLEAMVNYAFYAQFNRLGHPSRWLLLVTAMVGAARATASLFLLLLVAIGYGVMLPSLADKAAAIYTLTGAHLAASLGAILVAATWKRGSPLALLLSTLPVSLTYSAFLSWILTALKLTKETLALRKQSTKLAMYHAVTVILTALTLLAFALLILSVLVILGRYPGQAWYASHWASLWWWTDGWQMTLNAAGVACFAWIFRPREHNRSYDLEEVGSDPIDLEVGVSVEPEEEYRPVEPEEEYPPVEHLSPRLHHPLSAPSRDSLGRPDPWKPQ